MESVGWDEVGGKRITRPDLTRAEPDTAVLEKGKFRDTSGFVNRR